MSLADSFLSKIETFLTESGMAPTIFGQAAVGDGNFVRDLRAGRMPSLRMADKVNAYIEAERAKMTTQAAE